MTDEFPVVVTGLITNKGDVLSGKKEEIDDHPMSEQWHLPGGHLEKEEELREKVKKKVEDKTGLEVEVHQLVDLYYDEEGELLRAVFHCESDSREAEASGNLKDVEWIGPGELEDELGELENEVLLERKQVKKFLDKLEKMPVF